MASAKMVEQDRPPEIAGYRLLRRIGAGGMGTVYEAEKLTTHETFAVKMIREHLASDPSHAARFEREVDTLRRIRHSNVVEVYEWSLPAAGAPGQRFVVMELLHGETLQQLLERTPVLPPARAVAIGLQILDGLAAAHEAGVVHRDLAPSNVFLATRPDGRLRVKLLDFGLARPLPREPGEAAVTEPGTFIGKPAFMAPEQFLERTAAEAADVFACGMMLYRVLTGRLPYRAVSAAMLWNERMAERESDEEYLPPSAFVPVLPDGLVGLVVQAIRKRPEDRIGSAREFQRALLAVEESLQPEAHPITISRLRAPSIESPVRGEPRGSTLPLAPSAFRWLRGRRRRVWAAAATLVATLGLAAWWLGSAAPSPPGNARSGPGGAGQEAQTGNAGSGTATGVRVDANVAAAAGVDANATVAEDAAVGGDPRALGGPAAAADGDTGTAVAATAFAGGDSGAAADAAPETATRAAVPPRASVRFRFVGVPRNAAARVDGRAVGPGAAIDLPRSAEPVDVEVMPAGGGQALYADRLVPDRDRTIRVPPAPGGGPRGRADAGGGTMRTDEGAVFATKWR